MEKLNIAELLKDCPKGTKLYTTVWGDVEFIRLCDVGMITILPISNPYNTINTKLLYSDGRFTLDGECILFPSKENRDWNTFQRPFKDGDIITTDLGSVFILKEPNKNIVSYGCRLATKEEKEKLFNAIKDNGYKWNAETKALEKLIEPRFKVGDKIRHKDDKNKTLITITGIKNDYYFIQFYNIRKNDYQSEKVLFKDQDKYELIPNKFDITTLKPFDKVLIRYANNTWHIQFFEKYDKRIKYPFICMNSIGYKQCIPYEGNEHLLNTTDECGEYYKTWE